MNSMTQKACSVTESSKTSTTTTDQTASLADEVPAISTTAQDKPNATDSTRSHRAATVNPCRLCAPLGASLAIRGVRGGVPILHGAQGCATYIRRYLISHFREPVDIASSSFGESAVVFGGEHHLFEALDNVVAKYDPEAVVVATTCLAETIGDDPKLSLPAYRRSRPDSPPVLTVSTPSYKAGHVTGFRDTVRALTEAFAPGGAASEGPAATVDLKSLALMPPMVSPADLRHLRSVAGSYELEIILAPDYSDTLDGGAWGEYKRLPDGGTPVDEWRALAAVGRCLELGDYAADEPTAGAFLESSHGIPRDRIPLPIGLEAADRFHAALAEWSGRGMPPALETERSRLVDSYADAHKYLFGKRVAIACNEHLTAALVRFTAELGMVPVMASGGGPTAMERALAEHPPEGGMDRTEILDDADFLRVEDAVRRLEPDLVISSSKAHRICRDAGVPLLRADFPIHDRFGGPRILNLDYRGTARLLDDIANALLAKKQADSPVGFSYQ